MYTVLYKLRYERENEQSSTTQIFLPQYKDTKLLNFDDKDFNTNDRQHKFFSHNIRT